MIKVLLFDFARVILFPKHETLSTLGALYAQQSGAELFFLNTELLNFIKTQRDNYTTAILTNSASILAPGTLYRQQMEAYFDQIFLSKELGLSKDQPACYLKVAELLAVEPSEILFTDDSGSKCQAATEAGLKVILFESTDQYLREVAKVLV